MNALPSIIKERKIQVLKKMSSYLKWQLIQSMSLTSLLRDAFQKPSWYADNEYHMVHEALFHFTSGMIQLTSGRVVILKEVKVY